MSDEQAITIVGIGELLWDCFGDSRRPGGAPANFAYHAQQLGANGVVCSRVGTDDAGDELLAHLREHGCDTRFVQRDSHQPTGLVTVDASRPDHPIYTIHENVAWDALALSDEMAKLFTSAEAVCFGTLAQRSITSRNTIEKAIALCNNALIVYDVNLRPPWYSADVIRNSLQRANVVKLNAEEAAKLAELLSLEGKNAEPIGYELVKSYHLDLVCITRGADGCLLITPDEIVDQPGKSITVVDAVGAGDAFTAALVYGLLKKAPLRAIASFANQVGAMIATRAGAMPDVRASYDALKQRIFAKSK